MKRFLLCILCALFGAMLCGQGVHIHSIEELNRSFGVDTHLRENRYKLEPDYRTIVELGEEELGHKNLHYPRIKQLRDGSFILFYQSSRIGLHCYCAYSEDGIHWTQGGRVFEGHKIVNSGGEPDTRAYSTVDAVVLDNGDILAFVSYRAVKGYKRFPQDDGLSMKRSTDGGRTWGEEIELYKTITWEPYAMQLPSGEVQVYFTDSDHDWVPASSGVTMLRSLDRGQTWTTQCQAIRHYKAMARRADGQPGSRISWTDQMPCATLLGDGKTILAAVETQDSLGRFFISLVKDDTNFATTYTGSREGPPDRLDKFRSGGGPYLAHFPSGETALSFHGKYFNIKLGKSDFMSIRNAYAFQPFGRRHSLWGSMTTIDSHTAFATAPSLNQTEKEGTIMLGRMRLNHRVDAPYDHVRVDGNNIEWGSNTDALFLGSESPAQVSMRFAHDEQYLYMLVEYLDEDLIPRDNLRLLFGNGQNGNDIFETRIRCDFDGKVKAGREVVSSIYREEGKGYMAELAIPISDLPFVEDRIFLYAEIRKAGMVDAFTEVQEKQYERWMPIRIQQ